VISFQSLKILLELVSRRGFTKPITMLSYIILFPLFNHGLYIISTEIILPGVIEKDFKPPPPDKSIALARDSNNQQASQTNSFD